MAPLDLRAFLAQFVSSGKVLPPSELILDLVVLSPGPFLSFSCACSWEARGSHVLFALQGTKHICNPNTTN